MLDLLGPPLYLLGSLPQSAEGTQFPGEAGSQSEGEGAESFCIQHDIMWGLQLGTHQNRGTCRNSRLLGPISELEDLGFQQLAVTGAHACWCWLV